MDLERDWADAARLVEAVRRELAPAVRRLRWKAFWLRLVRPHRYREFTVGWVAAARADPRDRHLVTGPVSAGERWHPAVADDGLVTPGFSWVLERTVARRGVERDYLVAVVLTVDESRTPVLRSGPQTRPATRDGWTELSKRILGPPQGLPAPEESRLTDTMLGELSDWLKDAVSAGLSGLGYLLICAVPLVLLLALVGMITRCTG